ncbi:hypothetical protein [Sporosarcina ureilytica]|uniref:Uncharacterized protein n=1 Tax=Sporosarcina ureilytica TaxID=298596 RepID=A0A1D8JFL7_9BACL|nr:hypothetical protein [Sporosarcina ureilytica]AOV07493.1 hypothetical protein BI350_08080 [Sporosarcina ureilytica]
MKTCFTCNKRFRREPFRIHSDKGSFCSIDCLPEGILDEPYAFTYANLMEQYINLTSHSGEFKDITERDEQLDKIDLLVAQCEEYVFGDEGVFFYQDELRRLYDIVETLYQSVANHFLDVENYIYLDGLYVLWDHMPKDIALGLESILKNILDEQQWKPFISYNESLDAMSEDLNIIIFPENDYMDKLELEHLYETGIHYLQNAWDGLEEEIHECFFYIQMAICPICTWPEPFEDFGINEDFQAYVCSGFCATKTRR